MKTAAFTIAALAGLVAGQSLGDIPNCASQCAQDMLSNQGTEEIDNCDARDLGCLCQNEKFILGIRDCTQATCNNEDAMMAVQAGVRACRNAGVEITAPGSTATDGSASGSMTASATTTGGNGGGAGGLVSTITSDGSTMVTTLTSSGDLGDSISSGLGSLSSGLGSLTSGVNSVTSAIGSVTSEMGSSMTSAMESATETSEGGDSTSTEGGNGGNGDETETGSDGSATSTDGDDAAPMRTAAPAGIIAAAGLAAFML